MHIRITVMELDANVGAVVDLPQEAEDFWPQFVGEMVTQGYDALGVCRVIAERIKGTVQPVLTAGPVDSAAEAGDATANALARQAVQLAFREASDELNAEAGKIVGALGDLLEDLRLAALTSIDKPPTDAKSVAA